MVMMETAYAYKYSVYIIQLDVFRCTVQHPTELWKKNIMVTIDSRHLSFTGEF